MAKIILTVDDNPQKVTRSVVDFMVEKNIPAVLFIIGQEAAKDRESMLYALNKGFIIGNHSYTHPFFSQLSFEECVEEIEKTEEVIESLYKEAGIERPVKLFRFPYIDKGQDMSEEHKQKLQDYLKEKGFKRIDDSEIKTPGYYRNGWDKERDITFSYDCMEYMVRPDQMTFEECMQRLRNGDEESGAHVLTDDSLHMILIHTHDDTENMEKDYFQKIVGEMIKSGAEFVAPNFID